MLFGGLWLFRPNDTVFGWFFGAALCWSVHQIAKTSSDIPWPGEEGAALWEALRLACLHWGVLLITVFNHRYAGIHKPIFERRLLLGGIPATLPLLYPDLAWVHAYGYGIYYLLTAAVGAYTIGFLFRRWRKTRDPALLLLTLSGSSIMLTGLHDLGVVRELVDWRDGLWMYNAALISSVLVAHLLLRRFAQALTTAEQLTNELEARVARREAQIRKSYEQIAQLERDAELAQERQRIMGDMHDGVAGQLLGVVTELRQCEADLAGPCHRLQQALDDLRLVIDSLDPDVRDLGMLMGMLRSRIGDRPQAAGMQLEWRVEHLPADADLEPGVALQILRILHEAITNAVRHSAGDRLSVSARRRGAEQIEFVVADNGRGLPEELSEGRGLGNMRRRAGKIGAELVIEDAVPGMRIGLVVSVGRQQATARCAE